MKSLHGVSFVLVIVGALNWGLVGLGSFMGRDWNVVHLVLGQWMTLENLVYVLVGLAAISLIATHKQDCRYCNASGPSGMM